MSTEGAVGFVLAGGQSRRMGQDKALLTFEGQPLISRAVNILGAAGLDVAIAGERRDLSVYAPVVEDRVRAQGPLGGVCAALESTEAKWAVFITVDTPLLPAELISYLLRHAQTANSAVTVASIAGETHTFPAVLNRAVLPLLRSELEAGRLKCFSAFDSSAKALGQKLAVVPAELLSQTGEVADSGGLSPANWFLNVNTPDEFRNAESLIRPPIS